MLQQALDLLQIGNVFPLHNTVGGCCSCGKGTACESPGKHPLTANGVKDASADPDQIKRWWREYPNANIGLAGGATIFVDLDDGAEESDLAIFPRTVTVKTRDGYHLYFKAPEGGIKNGNFDLPNASGRASAAKTNVRGSGYYVVAPGSVVNGHEYQWHSDLGGELSPQEAQLASVPDWLLGAKSPTPPNASAAPDSQAVTPGSRHDKLKSMCIAGRKKGKPREIVEKELLEYNSKKCVPPKPVDEIQKLLDYTYREVAQDPNKRPVGRPRKEGETPYALYTQFMDELGLQVGHQFLIRCQHRTFYSYRNKCYRDIEDDILVANINDWLIDSGKEHLAASKKSSDMLTLMQREPVLVPREIELPAIWQDGAWQTAKHLIPFQNGILDMREFMLTGRADLVPHTPDFFCNYVLPFEFDPKAQCPVFDKIADFTFNDAHERRLWEEIMGIHLYQPFPLEHFFVLQGEGANGKSVLVNVLSSLLGSDNVSSVALECFKPEGFFLIHTYGKLANIVQDQHDLGDINEGILKKFVSREPISFNRKNKPIFEARPTCFLTICTNHVPTFKDKTDGMWRRMRLFQLKKQVPSDLRNPRYIDRDFWAASGELPGVFNLALAGLQRVAARGRLAQVESMEAELAEHRMGLNNVASFIDECVDAAPATLHFSAMDIFKAYCAVTRANGGSPLGRPKFQKQFAQDLARAGIASTYGHDKIRMGHYVGRSWTGLRLNDASKDYYPDLPNFIDTSIEAEPSPF